MVKALAESGLADYEPYSGVRLTPAVKRPAGLVLRRHRLVELFLVQVMGMSWAEVHEEAEHLIRCLRAPHRAHRSDAGRPTHDPHGDPIPNPDGAIARRNLDTLLTCPLSTPLRVTRIADQDPAFLRFIEKNDLKPGEAVEVETRDAAADSSGSAERRHRPDHRRTCCVEAARRARASRIRIVNPTRSGAQSEAKLREKEGTRPARRALTPTIFRTPAGPVQLRSRGGE